MARLSKITTKTGDNGTTGLADGTRLSKTDKRVHLMGEIDELNACIGLCISLLNNNSDDLIQIQHDLFDIGAELCQPGKNLITDDYIVALDEKIEAYNAQLPALKEFILPGGSTLLAQLHICRTVCRRCERTACDLKDSFNPKTLQFLNRLSDYLFVFARFTAKQTKTAETFWQSEYSRQQ